MRNVELNVQPSLSMNNICLFRYLYIKSPFLPEGKWKMLVLPLWCVQALDGWFHFFSSHFFSEMEKMIPQSFGLWLQRFYSFYSLFFSSRRWVILFISSHGSTEAETSRLHWHRRRDLRKREVCSSKRKRARTAHWGNIRITSHKILDLFVS